MPLQIGALSPPAPACRWCPASQQQLNPDAKTSNRKKCEWVKPRRFLLLSSSTLFPTPTRIPRFQMSLIGIRTASVRASSVSSSPIQRYPDLVAAHAVLVDVEMIIQGCIQPERPERNLSGAPRRLSGAAPWLQISRLRTGLSQNNCDTICEIMLRHGVFFSTGASHCHARQPRPKCARGPARNYSVELACAAQIARRCARINSIGGRARTAPRSRTETPIRRLTELPFRPPFEIVIMRPCPLILSSIGLVVKACKMPVLSNSSGTVKQLPRSIPSGTPPRCVRIKYISQRFAELFAGIYFSGRRTRPGQVQIL